MSPIGGSRVIVFAKAPRPGLVKTRLALLLGAQGAAALHARLVKHTLAMARTATRAKVELHGDPIDDDFLRYCAARYGTPLVAQEGRDLGERMQHAFDEALTEPGSRAVLIGTDCPALSGRHLRRALHALEEGYDAVYAPAEDGGYALVGLARSTQRLFEGIAWGSASVMEETRSRMRELQWCWRELETLWDVDRPADYVRLLSSGLMAVPHQKKFAACGPTG